MEKTLKEQEKVKAVLATEIKSETQDIPKYSDEDKLWIGGLMLRMEMARNQRDRVHDEFDGMTYVQYWDSNERLAATTIVPKKNKEDTNFMSGTIRQKLFSLLSYINNLDLTPDIHAYDKNNFEIQSIGQSFENIIEKTEELDSDPEKKMLRQYELLKQGSVFVRESWEKKYWFQKPMKGTFDGKWDSITWTKKVKELYSRPTRHIIPGINVYLGSMTTYDYTRQPFIFTADYRSYDEMKSMFGDWEMWPYVSKKVQSVVNGPAGQSGTDINGRQIVFNNWRLNSTDEDLCEWLTYESVIDNEFGVIINGILMTPPGMPLPWGYPEYDIVQQNLRPYHHYFAYGKSFPAELRTNTEIYDAMLRAAVLKTQQSFAPPMLNLSGRVLSSRIMMPGHFTMGVQPGSVVPLHDKITQGATQSEFAMIQELRKHIDDDSIPPIVGGQSASGDQTATEMLMLQRQAKINLGITIFAMSLLEWKLSWLRIFNLLENWFEPIDTAVDDARKELKNVYRSVNSKQSIEGEGNGRIITMLSKDKHTPEDIYKAEESMSKDYGYPVRIIMLDPDELKKAKITWEVIVTPREKKSSEVSKLLFRGEMSDLKMFDPMTVNWPFVQEKFATVWDDDPVKLFKSSEQAQQGIVAPGNVMPAQGPMPPSPDKGMGKMLNNQLQ